MPRVTSADVARESGVSRTTVSYVLNARQDVVLTEATRKRVLETAERMGYTPSAAARALRSGRSDLVLCVLPDWTLGPAVDTLFEHLSSALAEHGLSVLVHIRHGGRPLDELWRAVTPCAVLALSPFPERDTRAMRRAGIPVVGTTLDDDPQPDVFAVPQAGIGALQVEHLASRGHRMLGYAAARDLRLSAFADRRLAGARDACARLGLPAPRVATVDVDPAAAREAVLAWRAEGVTGVAAYNDEVALAVLAGLRGAGLEAPGDVAVVGVDDIPAARVAAPALTTVWQAIDAQAQYLAAAVLSALGLADAPSQRPGDVFHLVERDST